LVWPESPGDRDRDRNVETRKPEHGVCERIRTDSGVESAKGPRRGGFERGYAIGAGLSVSSATELAWNDRDRRRTRTVRSRAKNRRVEATSEFVTLMLNSCGNIRRENGQRNQCPVADGFDATPSGRRPHQDWWPNQLKLDGLERKPPSGNPMGPTFNYVEEFKSLDLDAVKKDIMALMTTPKSGAGDYGHYGRSSSGWPGTALARTGISDGRGGGGSAPSASRHSTAGRQRESRQGPKADLADQAEVRTKDLLGRLDNPHGHTGARVDGLKTYASPAGARTSSRAMRTSIGVRGRLAGRQTIQR